jgi:soluble P-type ATPase
LVDVGVSNPDDPITDLIAKAVVIVIASGERSPEVVAERALNALGVRKSSAA